MPATVGSQVHERRGNHHGHEAEDVEPGVRRLERGPRADHRRPAGEHRRRERDADADLRDRHPVGEMDEPELEPDGRAQRQEGRPGDGDEPAQVGDAAERGKAELARAHADTGQQRAAADRSDRSDPEGPRRRPDPGERGGEEGQDRRDRGPGCPGQGEMQGQPDGPSKGRSARSQGRQGEQDGRHDDAREGDYPVIASSDRGSPRPGPGFIPVPSAAAGPDDLAQALSRSAAGAWRSGRH